jgi:hypothetical protein
MPALSDEVRTSLDKTGAMPETAIQTDGQAAAANADITA